MGTFLRVDPAHPSTGDLPLAPEMGDGDDAHGWVSQISADNWREF